MVLSAAELTQAISGIDVVVAEAQRRHSPSKAERRLRRNRLDRYAEEFGIPKDVLEESLRAATGSVFVPKRVLLTAVRAAVPPPPGLEDVALEEPITAQLEVPVQKNGLRSAPVCDVDEMGMSILRCLSIASTDHSTSVDYSTSSYMVSSY